MHENRVTNESRFYIPPIDVHQEIQAPIQVLTLFVNYYLFIYPFYSAIQFILLNSIVFCFVVFFLGKGKQGIQFMDILESLASMQTKYSD